MWCDDDVKLSYLSTWYVEPLNKQVEKLNRCGEGAVRCEERLQVRADHTCTQVHPDHIMHILIFSLCFCLLQTFMNMGVA